MRIEENTSVEVIITMLDDKVPGGFFTDVSSRSMGAEDRIQVRGCQTAAEIDIFDPCRGEPLVVPANFQQAISLNQDECSAGVLDLAVMPMIEIHHPIELGCAAGWQQLVQKQ